MRVRDARRHELRDQQRRLVARARRQGQEDVQARRARRLERGAEAEPIELLLHPRRNLDDALELRARARIEIDDGVVREVRGS